MGTIQKQLRERPEYQAGVLEADTAIQNGKLEYRLSGKLDQITCEIAADILLTQYQIRLVINNRSIVDIERAALDEGFNDRMQAEIVKRFDLDVVKYIFEQAAKKRK